MIKVRMCLMDYVGQKKNILLVETSPISIIDSHLYSANDMLIHSNSLPTITKLLMVDISLIKKLSHRDINGQLPNIKLVSPFDLHNKWGGRYG